LALKKRGSLAGIWETVGAQTMQRRIKREKKERTPKEGVEINHEEGGRKGKNGSHSFPLVPWTVSEYPLTG